MQTYSAKTTDINRKWYVVDAEGKTLGRLATEIAFRLIGKHKPMFTPHIDTGDFIIVINCEKVRVSGSKETQKSYWRHTGFPGGGRSVTVETQRSQHPDRIISEAVSGMLPKNKMRDRRLTRLKIYAGAEHPHAAQMPEVLEIAIPKHIVK